MLTENIKVSEVSEVLLKQLEGIDTHVQLDEVGTVLQVSDGVVRIFGLHMPRPASCWNSKTASRPS